MPARTPEERALVARIASKSRWGKEPDRVAATEAMRRGRRAKYAEQVLRECPGLSGDELERRIDDLRDADMLRMSLRSKQLRRKAAEQLAAAEAAEAALADMQGGAA